MGELVDPEDDDDEDEFESLVLLDTSSHDAARLGYPPTLPVELALKEKTPRELCAIYGISHDEWNRLRQDPVFVADVKARSIELETDGLSFKMKAQLQAVELLKKSWDMIHGPKTPPAVAADLIKFTVRAAGLDGSKDQALAATQQNALQINIHL